eukprot:Phypoly_transcript_14903.p1 GENE.Phypoly_transcript_14903~~Phypoly_transcript_14903.p1  ORF type:complete len:276 (+),score=15.79 Phypoly_transcript_14903:66-893(+)
MSTRVVLANSKPVVDFSKYARPELITAVSRVADFFGDAVQSVAVPPACLVLVTLMLTYFLPFSSTLASILFLMIGITGSILTGLSYGALKFVTMAARDLKFIITETLYLVHSIISDVSGYIHNPAAFPPLSDIVHGVLITLIKPVILGVFDKKFYGGILKLAADPLLSGVDKWLTTVVASMERRFVNASPSKGTALNDSHHQHDKKSRHEGLATENLDGAVLVRRDRLYEALENVRKRTVPKIDEYARKLNRPLRFFTFLFAAVTLLLTSLIYSM